MGARGKAPPDAAAMSRSVPLAKGMDDAMLTLYQNGERVRRRRHRSTRPQLLTRRELDGEPARRSCSIRSSPKPTSVAAIS
jgi:hypothetical protein